MHRYFNSTVFQRIVVLAIAILAAAWWFSVPGVMTPATFVAVLAFLAASGWILKSTYENAQPASSLAQSLHDVEKAAALKRARQTPNEY